MSHGRLHIGVIGAGAVGCYVGGRLVASGVADVTLVGRQWLADAISAHGLTLRELDHDDLVAANDIRFAVDPQAGSTCDVVLCCVKSGATADTAAQLAGILRPDAIVVSLQNGLRNAETLRAHLPQNHVIDAIVDFNVIMRSEGDDLGLVEVQGTGEEGTFSRAQLNEMLDLAEAVSMALGTP